MNASHPQLPLGLGPKWWAISAFSDQEQGLQDGIAHLGPSYGSLRHLRIISCKRTRCHQKTGMNALVGIHTYLKKNSLNKAPGHNEESLNAKEIMIYWTMRLIKGKGWQASESEKLHFLKLNFLKRPISKGSTFSFESPYRLVCKVEDRGESL